MKLRIALESSFPLGLQAIGALSAHSAEPAPGQDKPQVAHGSESFNILGFKPGFWQRPTSIKRPTTQSSKDSHHLTRGAVANG